MIKFVQCVRRKPGLSKQEFREQWAAYGQHVKAVAKASKAKRCVLSTALVVEQNMNIMQSRGTKAPYDGMAEVWWERGGDVVAFLESGTSVELLENMRRAQEAIMDLPNCTFFFASEDA
jgi:EthD domain